MEPLWITIISIVVSVGSATGFFAWIQKKNEAKDVKQKMLMGLGHDRIIYLSLQYINRGYVSEDEFENLNKYLYEPYKELGGNGTVKRLMGEVEKLPIKRVYIKQGDDNNE